MTAPEKTSTIFVDNLRRLLEALQVSVEQLATSTGLDPRVIELLMNGQRSPTVDELASIARAMQIEPENLIEPGTNDDSLFDSTEF